MNATTKIKILPELKNLIPPLTPEEYAQLEANCIQYGIQDKLKIARYPDSETGEELEVLADGHNRYKIAQSNGLAFEVEYLEFSDFEEVADWMDKNQLGRRNLSPEQMSLLRGRRYNRMKRQGERMDLTSDHFDQKLDTSQVLANQHGVSAPTIRRDGQFARAVEQLSVATNKSDYDVLQMYATKKDTIKAAQIIKAKPNAVNDALALTKERKAQKAEALKAAQKKKEQTLNGKIKQKPIVKNISASKLLQSFDDASIDLLFTDPPYFTEYADRSSFKSFLGRWLPDVFRKTNPTGRIFICTGAYPDEVAAYLDYFIGDMRYKHNYKPWICDNPLIWTYRNTLGQTPKHKYNLNYQFIWHLYTDHSRPLDNSITNEMFSVQDIPAPDGRHGNRYHTWQKPDELANRIIRHASKEGDLVVDPFACTGTFLLAAARAGRRAIGGDISKGNLLIAKKRGCELEK